MSPTSIDSDLVKWRLILGGGDANVTGISLNDELAGMDSALEALYGFDEKGRFEYGEEKEKGKGGRGGSMPNVSRWLGDIREYFPNTVVEVLQADAMKHESLRQIML